MNSRELVAQDWAASRPGRTSDETGAAFARKAAPLKSRESKIRKLPAFTSLLALLGVLVAAAWGLLACIAGAEHAVPQITATLPPPTTCLPVTPEPLWVEPVGSPKDLLSQVVTVTIGNGDWVRIKTASGEFLVTGNFGTGNPALVTVSLWPCATHHLDVAAHVREMRPPCWYGGYVLHTSHDRYGAPLVIVQMGPSGHRFHLPLLYR